AELLFKATKKIWFTLFALYLVEDVADRLQTAKQLEIQSHSSPQKASASLINASILLDKASTATNVNASINDTNVAQAKVKHPPSHDKKQRNLLSIVASCMPNQMLFTIFQSSIILSCRSLIDFIVSNSNKEIR
ncbi:MAG: hypothetical protein CUN55_19665, partial [Phototrophicales bacterium]